MNLTYLFEMSADGPELTPRYVKDTSEIVKDPARLVRSQSSHHPSEPLGRHRGTDVN
jgi:hypothetical protein